MLFRSSQSPIYGTVGSTSVVAKKKLTDKTSLYLSGGVDVGSGYTNGTIMVGLTVDF